VSQLNFSSGYFLQFSGILAAWKAPTGCGKFVYREAYLEEKSKLKKQKSKLQVRVQNDSILTRPAEWY